MILKAMKSKIKSKIKNIAMFFCFAVVIGCNSLINTEKEENDPYNLAICLSFDFENPEKSIPVINTFLSSLPDGLTGEQKIDELKKWLNMQPCVVSAIVDHYSAIKTNPPTGEIHLRLFGGNRGYFYVMDIAWTNPMTITGFHDIFYTHEDYNDVIIVPSTEYSLNNTPCDWNNDEWNLVDKTRKLIVINSKEELEKYITCSEGGDYPAIDFTERTMLLVFGVDGGTVNIESTYLQQISTSYVLNVEFYASLATVITWWQTAIVTDKLDKNSDIEVKVNYLISE